MGLRDDILKDLLPTKWSRWIGALSIASGTAAFFLPEFLKLLCIKISECTALLLRISTPLFLWLLGSLLVLAILVHYSKTIKPPLPPPPPPPLPKPSLKLPPLQEKLLLHLFNHKHKERPYTFQIAQAPDMPDEDTVKYNLEDLRKNKYVRPLNPPVSGLQGQQSWSIEPKGEKYLRENNKITQPGVPADG